VSVSWWYSDCVVVVWCVCQASTVIELSSLAGVTLDADERYIVRLLSVDGGAVLGTVVSRTLVLLASASPSGVMQLYFAGSRHYTVIVLMIQIVMLYIYRSLCCIYGTETVQVTPLRRTLASSP